MNGKMAQNGECRQKMHENVIPIYKYIKMAQNGNGVTSNGTENGSGGKEG
jgi:hypothetical protein